MRTGFLIDMDGVIYRENQLIPGAREYSYLVLSGSTQLENVSDYVYQPTRILQTVGDLVVELKTGRPSDRLSSPAFADLRGRSGKKGERHQTDVFAFHKPRPRPAMTK